MRTLSDFTKAASGLLLLAFLVIIAGFSPMSINQSSRVDIKSLVKKTVDAFNNRTPELAEQVFAPKFIYHPGSATQSSEQTIRSFYDSNLATYPDFKFTLEDAIAEGNKVAIRIIFEGTHKTSGKKIRVADHWIGRAEGGKFVEAWEVVDALTWNQQLGYTITPPEQKEGQEKANIQEQNKALVRRANEEILNKGNLAFADEVFATDYVAHGSTERGPEMIKKFVAALRTAFPDLHVSVEPIIAEGDMVAWQRTHTGTHQGKYMGMPATGKSVTWQTMVISRYVDGKVVEEWGIGDLQERLGK